MYCSSTLFLYSRINIFFVNADVGRLIGVKAMGYGHTVSTINHAL